MEQFSPSRLGESFALFERAAAKGHEEAIWILSVVKDVEMEKSIVKEAFAKTEEPLGYYFASKFSDGRERFDFFKKSVEGGCSWGQVEYGWCFRYGEEFVQQDTKVYVKWLEKAADQNNSKAMFHLGYWFRKERGNKEKAVLHYRASAQLGWGYSMHRLAEMLRNGEGCGKDLRHAAIWSAKGDSYLFWEVLKETEQALKSGATEDLDCDFNHLCYSLGWGLY
jgi:TPR repeat protein